MIKNCTAMDRDYLSIKDCSISIEKNVSAGRPELVWVPKMTLVKWKNSSVMPKNIVAWIVEPFIEFSQRIYKFKNCVLSNVSTML